MVRARAAAQRSPQLAWFITGALAVVAVSLSGAIITISPAPFGRWPLAALFFALFWLAEVTVLKFEVKRQIFSVSLTEIPLLLALVFLPPMTVVVTRMAAVVLSQLYLRIPTIKICFNLSVLSASTALGSLVVLVSPPIVARSPSSWLTLSLAVTLVMLTTLAAVVGVITLVQGRISAADLISTVVSCTVVAEINVVVGLVVLLAITETLWAVMPLAGIAVVFVMAYRRYAMFVRQHKSLADLYDLTRAVTEGGRDGAVTDVLLGRVRELLRAEYATLWLPAATRHPEVLLSARADYTGLLDSAGTPDALRLRALRTGATIAVGPKLGDEHVAADLRGSAVKDAIVVPLRSGEAVIGTLEVAGRLGDTAHFGPEDVRLVETVAAHAGVAVENSRLVDRLRFDAYHDSLTGLPNRRRLLGALGDAIKAQSHGEVVGVLLFDIADLRAVNDSLGYAAGDELVTEFARRLRTLAPPAALVARIGSDEFALTVRTSSAETAVALAVRVRESMQQPMELGALTIDVDCAVGVAVHPEHGADAATLLQRADVATHAAKVRQSAVQLFTPSLESRSVRQVGLAADLRRALDTGEIEVYFQPKVGLCDRRLVGVECLARWDHPVHGPVTPDDFVAVAEHTGQLHRLTEFVLREAVRRSRDWADTGREVPVAVNLAGRTLLDPQFPDRVAQLLREYGLDPGRLTFEFTEDGVVADSERPVASLDRLRELGVRLSVDDFGAGYSSLSLLRRLPVHEIKIDRAFVQGMATDDGDLAVVRAMVDMARHFGLTVVAEGVESERTLSLLEDIGCDVGQGFLFSRPLPYERLEAWCAAQTAVEPTSAGEVRWLRAVP